MGNEKEKSLPLAKRAVKMGSSKMTLMTMARGLHRQSHYNQRSKLERLVVARQNGRLHIACFIWEARQPPRK
jgi:hypothetical protein